MSTQEYYNEFYRKNTWKYIQVLTKKKLKTYLKILNTILPGSEIKSILDAGCGKGELTYLFHSLGYTAKGFDFSEEAILEAKRSYKGIEFRQMDGKNLKYREPFDLIFAKGFSPFNTTHFEESTKILEHWKDFLTPGGRILIVTRSNFSEKAPTGWIYLTKDQIADLYKGDKKVFYLYNPFWMIILLLPASSMLLRIFGFISERIIAELFRIPVTVFIFLKNDQTHH